MTVAGLLMELTAKGIQLWIEDGGVLRYRAPGGVFTQQLKDEVLRRRAELIRALLAGAERRGSVYRYRLTDNPAEWLHLITPGDSLEEARDCLERFWGTRLIEVAPHSAPLPL